MTAEDLKRDVSVNSVRFTPVVWSGVPFLSVTILFCATDAIIIPPDQPQSTGEASAPHGVNDPPLLLRHVFGDVMILAFRLGCFLAC